MPRHVCLFVCRLVCPPVCLTHTRRSLEHGLIRAHPKHDGPDPNDRTNPEGGTTDTEAIMFKLTLRYARYALSALATVGFLTGFN
jgi:hypothetical protein